MHPANMHSTTSLQDISLVSQNNSSSEKNDIFTSLPLNQIKAGGDQSTLCRSKKPQFSYIALITAALRSAPRGRLTLLEITAFLKRRWPFFRDPRYTGWKNSLRHNLSLNNCFVKILRDPRRPYAKNNYWTLNETGTKYTGALGDYSRRRKRTNQQCNQPYSSKQIYHNECLTSTKVEDALSIQCDNTSKQPVCIPSDSNTLHNIDILNNSINSSNITNLPNLQYFSSNSNQTNLSFTQDKDVSQIPQYISPIHTLPAMSQLVIAPISPNTSPLANSNLTKRKLRSPMNDTLLSNEYSSISPLVRRKFRSSYTIDNLLKPSKPAVGSLNSNKSRNIAETVISPMINVQPSLQDNKLNSDDNQIFNSDIVMDYPKTPAISQFSKAAQYPYHHNDQLKRFIFHNIQYNQDFSSTQHLPNQPKLQSNPVMNKKYQCCNHQTNTNLLNIDTTYKQCNAHIPVQTNGNTCSHSEIGGLKQQLSNTTTMAPIPAKTLSPQLDTIPQQRKPMYGFIDYYNNMP